MCENFHSPHAGRTKRTRRYLILPLLLEPLVAPFSFSLILYEYGIEARRSSFLSRSRRSAPQCVTSIVKVIFVFAKLIYSIRETTKAPGTHRHCSRSRVLANLERDETISLNAALSRLQTQRLPSYAVYGNVLLLIDLSYTYTDQCDRISTVLSVDSPIVETSCPSRVVPSCLIRIRCSYEKIPIETRKKERTYRKTPFYRCFFYFKTNEREERYRALADTAIASRAMRYQRSTIHVFIEMYRMFAVECLRRSKIS